MVQSHNLTDHLQKLYQLHADGIKFGLEAEAALLAGLGNPERKIKKIIHVAGTNGKGSVCALLESVLRAAGYKTGLYTSPHLVRINERIQANGKFIPDEEFIVLIDLIENYASDYARHPGGRPITFFEFLTALAFEYFRRQHVDVVVLETGMGGRLDATNVVMPQVAVITSISLEHTPYLGASIEEIAAEKGGIIKPGLPVIIGNLPQEARTVIEKKAQTKNARVIRAGQIVSVRRRKQTLEGQKISIESSANSYGTIQLPLLGAHQLENAAIAVAALEEFCRINKAELPAEALKKGLRSVSWPGRFQVISRAPLTIVDGAHNPEAAAVLNNALRELFADKPIFLILGMCADKDVPGFIRNLTVPIRHCWLVSFSNERSIPPEKLAPQTRSKGWPLSIARVPQALAEAGRLALESDGVVCAAGSFYLAGEILALQEGATEFKPEIF